MLDLLKNLEKKENIALKDIELLEKEFNESVDNLKNISGLEGAAIDVTLITKISYYNTIIKMSKMNLDTAKKILIPELIKDYTEIDYLLEQSKENLGKLQELKNLPNFYIEGDEIIFSTKSDKFGLFITYQKGDILRTINFASKKEGYHIFGDGRFCSGNTYTTLKDLITKQKVFLFILFLRKILTDYDDKHHHLAKASDFELWQRYLKSKKEEDKKELLKIFNEKKKKMLEFAKKDLSKDGYMNLIAIINRLKKEYLA